MSTHDTDTRTMLLAAITDHEQAKRDAAREIATIARIIKTERPGRARLAELSHQHVEAVEDAETYRSGLAMLRAMLAGEPDHQH